MILCAKISEHSNVETLRNLCKWKIADFDEISQRDVSEIIQSYFTNHSENWIEIFREHCSWSGLSISSYYRVWPPLAAITALSRRGMLHTRTSILSGVTGTQACNRASRNVATVVGGLSIYLTNSPIWSQICSMEFRSGRRADHCMTSTSSPLENCVYFVQFGVWHCHVQAQHFFVKLP